jgi:hypothetical protein
VEEEDCTGEDLTGEKGLAGEASRERGSRKRQGHMRAWGSQQVGEEGCTGWQRGMAL